MTSSVVFIHGLWVHASAWQPWLSLYSEAGFTAVAPGWPGDGDTVAETRRNPARVANHGIQAVTDHYAAIIDRLPERPIVIGHSIGGLVAQKLLADGHAVAAVAIDPAPVKGVKALPLAQIRSALPVLTSTSNRKGSVALTRRQFRYGFGNQLSRTESDDLRRAWAIPGPGRPIVELTKAKKDPASPTSVDLDDSDRGPLLIIGGAGDHTIPEVVAREAAALYSPGDNTDYRSIDGRGHSLVFDSGWREVADLSLDWLASRGFSAR
jgi:pimeloyl-ACP methyl ester carboxylesterase